MAAVAVARGSSFMFSKQLLDTMEPLNLLGVRSLIAFAVLMVFFGGRVVRAVQADRGNLRAGALMTAVNPMTTAVLGALILHEPFGILSISGAVLIIAAIIIHNLIPEKRTHMIE